MKRLIILVFLISTCLPIANAEFSFEDLDTGKTESVDLSAVEYPLQPYKPIVGKVKSLVMNNNINCVIDDEGEKCWGIRGSASIPKNLKNPSLIAIGKNHICTVLNGLVTCEGDNKYGQTSVPLNLKNTKMISAGYNHTCALDEEGVKCWGDIAPVPQFFGQPTWIYSSRNYSCVIINYGDGFSSVKCWGIIGSTQNWNRLFASAKFMANGKDFSCVLSEDEVTCMGYANFSIPENLNTPTLIAANDEEMCLVNDNRLICRTTSSEHSTPPNSLINPKMYASGISHSCALDDEGLKCWGKMGEYAATILKDFSGNYVPLRIVSGDNHVCAEVAYSDNRFIRCWGDNIFGQSDIPLEYSSKIKMAATGSSHTCIINDRGAKCWGANTKNQTNVPNNLKNPKNIFANGDMTCVIDAEGLKCWGIKNFQFIFDQSKYFYNEKGTTLKYAQDILNNVEDTTENELTLLYIREAITERFLTGSQSEASPAIINNSKNIRQLYKDKKLVTDGTLAARNTTQLRFVLDIMASTLVSSKYLLSDNSKITTEKFKVEFANVLTGDEINTDQASALISDLLNEKSLMNEMQSSHRLAGIKAFYDWAQSYVSTGKVD